MRRMIFCLIGFCIMVSCSGQFYTKPHVGPVFVQVKALAKDQKAFVCSEEIGEVDSLGKIFDRRGQLLGTTKYELLTEGDIWIRINAWAENGKLYTADSIYIGSINAKGNVLNSSGSKIGKRIASRKELFDYFERNEDHYQKNF